ncbi:TPA: hypothetical protein ACVGNQ_000661 [Pseudomonas aeruginosa]|uniref:hypothetical protein n=1 Tax=Pseudomonas aeruginosa TaxID=287 RepID=UPI00155A6298|nr:hypothetical protein [Pseudomonas aeruginosa]
MSLPINALKDDELLHYSQFDSGAADELARRLATGDLHIVDELSELEEYARELEEGKEGQTTTLRLSGQSAATPSPYSKP